MPARASSIAPGLPKPPNQQVSAALALAGVGCIAPSSSAAARGCDDFDGRGLGLCRADRLRRSGSGTPSIHRSVRPRPVPVPEPPPVRRPPSEPTSCSSSNRGSSCRGAAVARARSLQRQGSKVSRSSSPGVLDPATARASSSMVEVPCENGNSLTAILYKPPEDVEVAGLVLLVPGSTGGMGPGVCPKHAGLPLEKHASGAAFGSIFRRLGQELSSGLSHGWDGKPVSDEGSQGTSAPSAGKRERSMSKQRARCKGRGRGFAVLQMTWHQCKGGVAWPSRKLRRLESLRSAVSDVIAAARYLREVVPSHATADRLPLVLAGMSFGGPTVWAAAARLANAKDAGPLCGVACVAGSGRGGAAFETELLDTQGSINRCAGARVPMLFLHGTEDKNVALDVAVYFYNVSRAATEGAGGGTSSMVVIPGAAHLFAEARDKAFCVLHDWLVARLLLPLSSSQGLQARCLPTSPRITRFIEDNSGAFVIRRHAGRLSLEQFGMKAVSREDLLPESVRGYSEKDVELTRLQQARPAQQAAAQLAEASGSGSEESSDEEAAAHDDAIA